ncbi:MAG TPA: TonB-dependent receptor plug domain-containing protein [Syntrophorhabdaceae bacterium]|nr:TonB-dependent receptor plug domain-containing protein [Syntrophorhabdaceae bacterium]
MKCIFRRTLFSVLILGIFLISQMAFAQEKTEQKDPQSTQKTSGDQAAQKAEAETPQKTLPKSSHNLEEITVTGKKIAEPVTSPYAVAESSKLQTNTITSEQIEALHPETVWDVIEQLPGMEVTFQGRQHMEFSNMRGTGNFGIILDGVYVSQIDRILQTLPVDAIESVTVMRDSTALTLGPLTNFGSTTGDSNQGFIIIKTKRAAKLEGGTVASYGSFHTEKEHLYQGSKIGNFDYRVAGTYNNTLGKSNWYNASRNESALLRGGYTRSDLEADVLYYASRGMREFERGLILQPGGTGPVGTLDTSKWKIDPLISNMFAANLSKHWNDTHTTNFSYAYNGIIVTSMTTNFPDGKGQKVTFSDQDSRSQSLSLRHVLTSHNNILKAGGQWNDQVFPAANAPSSASRSDEDLFGLFAQDEYHMLNDRMTVDAGIRVDKELYYDSPVTYRPVNEWSRPVYAYTVGTAFKLIPKLTLTGRYAYTENYQSGYQDSVSKTVLPVEKRSRYEGGVLANLYSFLNPWLTIYYYDTANQKTSTTVGGQSSFIDPSTGDEIDYVTTTNIITRGAEFGSSGEVFKSSTYGTLIYRIQYTYVTTNDLSTNRSMGHNFASGVISYKYKNFDANFSARTVDTHGQSTSPIGTIYYELGGYQRYDANVAYNCKLLNRDTRITLYGRNLGNTHYATRYVTGTYRDPGLQVGVQLAYSFF